MLAYGIQAYKVHQALKEINGRYDGNVIFRTEPVIYHKDAVTFTLRVKRSSLRGALRDIREWTHYRSKKTFPPKLTINACWHVFGDMIDALFDNGATMVNSTLYRNGQVHSKEDNWKIGKEDREHRCDCHLWDDRIW